MQKLAVFDIDGTLFRWQLYHELVFELKTLGYFDSAEALSLDSALTSWQSKTISWKEYEQNVVDTIERNIAEITPSALESAARVVVKRSGHKIYGYTAKLLRDLQADGYYTLALSGSQQEIAEQFARRYGFDDCIGTEFERVDGHYTGNKSRFVPGNKAELIRDYLANHHDLTLDDSVAVGDSGGDISMLELVATPIAFNPSEELLDIAMTNAWRIVIERKNIAYTLESRDGSVVLAATDRF